MSILFRAMELRDLEDYITCAKEANFGFTTLPRDPKLVEKNLMQSLESFKKSVKTPGDEFYLFVAEDTTNNTILGISAIAATTGGLEPLYFFRNESYSVQSSIPSIVKEVRVLAPVSYVRSTSEVCSLFVHPTFQKLGIGKLLSFGRFLFMKAFSERFTGTIFSELRGVVDENSCSIFWENIGRHFFNQPLDDVYDMLQYGKAFVPEFLPKYPIYIDLLPIKVKETIGKNDPATQGALHLLREIGFQMTNEVDVFDAGPKLSARKETISIIKESRTMQIAGIKDSVEGIKYYLSNMRLAFRALYCEAICTEDSIIISREAAHELLVGLGDSITIYEGTKK